MRLVLLFLAVIPMLDQSVYSDESGEKDDRMLWFGEARLGIFIHWGIYAVNGIDESWSFYNDYISYDDYMKQLEGFTARRVSGNSVSFTGWDN